MLYDLYERWRQIARDPDRRRQIALRDLAADRAWTFAQLADETESGTKPEPPIAYPSGGRAAFVFEVLRAWRWGQVVCPLEEGAEPPALLRDDSAVSRLKARWSHGAHLKLTSATTGDARLVVFTGPQLAADSENIVRTMGLRSDWPNLGVISLAHSYGFSNLVLPLLLNGIPLALGGSPLPEAVRRAGEGFTAITLPAVPALWRAWHDAAAIPASTLLAISAGAPLPLPLETEVYQATGIKIHNFYGSSECGGIAYDRTLVPRTNAACVGTPMEGVRLGCDRDGCLEVRSHAVALGYWPEESPNLGEGRFRTSDLAEMQDGVVFLCGRASDLINVAGRKIAPETVERVLLTHPGVRECVVFGAPDTQGAREDRMVACIVPRERLSEEELRQFALARLPAWQTPRCWEFVDSLPVNSRGKLSRGQMQLWLRHRLETSTKAD